jgi:hypothetical protein
VEIKNEQRADQERGLQVLNFSIIITVLLLGEARANYLGLDQVALLVKPVETGQRKDERQQRGKRKEGERQKTQTIGGLLDSWRRPG